MLRYACVEFKQDVSKKYLCANDLAQMVVLNHTGDGAGMIVAYIHQNQSSIGVHHTSLRAYDVRQNSLRSNAFAAT